MISRLYKNSEDFCISSVSRVSFASPEWRLDGSGLFFMGSCFADYLHDAFSACGLDAGASPFGNIYNPASLAQAAELLSAGGGIAGEDCIESGGTYRHFMFHSLKNGNSAEALARSLNSGLAASRKYIAESEAAVITLGTSIVYRLCENLSPGCRKGSVVSNCHKLPSQSFTRQQLSPEEASEALARAVRALREIQPDLKIILTLSPVRHLRDNAAENSLSKAVLRVAIESLKDTKGLWYFPSYEIMLDELRDYRWYASDLCHPGAQAVDYIISRFISSAYSKRFGVFFSEWLKLQADLNHRPLRPESDEYKHFIELSLQKRRKLIEQYPEIRLAD